MTARSSGGADGVATRSTFQIDAGPILSSRRPSKARTLQGTLTVEVVADPDPFGLLDGPPTATVATPSRRRPRSQRDPTTPYRGTIDFAIRAADDCRRCSDEQLLTVWAVNANGKRTEDQVVFFIDNEGPPSSRTTPTPGEIIGHVIRISAIVQRQRGRARFVGDRGHRRRTGTPLFELPLKPRGGGLYSVLFDSARLTRCPEPPSDRPVHRVSDDLVPRIRPGRQRDGGRLRLRRGQHRAHGRSRSAEPARHPARRVLRCS